MEGRDQGGVPQAESAVGCFLICHSERSEESLYAPKLVVIIGIPHSARNDNHQAFSPAKTREIPRAILRSGSSSL